MQASRRCLVSQNFPLFPSSRYLLLTSSVADCMIFQASLVLQQASTTCRITLSSSVESMCEPHLILCLYLKSIRI